jgi:DNA polymerase-1
MSCSAPNLQNVPKRKDTGKYKARAAFIPRNDYFFAMLDYDQMEYRLFMDYAEEIELINKVLSGLDVHTATAEMVETSRDVAKTINFLLLYGGGAGKLAGELGISIELAKEYRNKYFQNLTAVKETSQLIVSTAENRGHIYNILGRRCFIPRKLAYKAPNYLIQGGCGDIVKRAMLSIDKFLEGKKSRMVLQIHDEILLEIHKDEYEIIDDIKEILVKSYEYKKLPLTAGADYSFTNWSEKRGLDYGEILNNLKAISAS